MLTMLDQCLIGKVPQELVSFWEQDLSHGLARSKTQLQLLPQRLNILLLVVVQHKFCGFNNNSETMDSMKRKLPFSVITQVLLTSHRTPSSMPEQSTLMLDTTSSETMLRKAI